MGFVKQIYAVPAKLVKRINDFSRKKLRSAWVIWMICISVLLLALIGLFIAVPSLANPILGFLGALASSTASLLGVLVTAIVGLLGTLVSAIAGLLSTLLNAIASLLATLLPMLVPFVLPFIVAVASLAAIGLLLFGFPTSWPAKVRFVFLLIAIIIFLTCISAAPAILPFLGVLVSLPIGYFGLIYIVDEGQPETWREWTFSAAILLIPISIFFISTIYIPGMTSLLNAIANLVATLTHTLILLLPLIGAITSLGAIALFLFLLYQSRYVVVDFGARERYHTKFRKVAWIWIVGIFIAVVVLIVSIPGLLNSTVSLVGGIVTALFAFLGIVSRLTFTAYTAWVSQRSSQEAEERADEQARWAADMEERARRVAERREHENIQERVLHDYIAEIPELLSKENSGESDKDDQKIAEAKAKTLAALLRLETRAKGILLQFLYDTNLIKTDQTADNDQALHVISLSGADLSEIEVPMANLSGATLGGVNLSGANLSGANLTDAVLVKVNLSGAVLDNATLSGAEGITNEELSEQAASLEGATMPNGQKYEDWVKSREEDNSSS